MRIFYTGSDMEDLAASGVKQLELGPGVALTDAARERAEELGISLVKLGSAPATQAVASAAAARSGTAERATLPVRPRGCQHGPLGKSSQGATVGGPVMEQLVDVVSALQKRGG